MGLGVNLTVDLCNVAAGIDDEGMPSRDGHASPLSEATVLICYFTCGIGQQRERQAVFFRKAGMAFGAVETDAQHLRIHGPQFEDVIPEIACLRGATGRIVFRVKVQHHPLAQVLLEAVGFHVLVLHGKSRRGLSDLKISARCRADEHEED